MMPPPPTARTTTAQGAPNAIQTSPASTSTPTGTTNPARMTGLIGMELPSVAVDRSTRQCEPVAGPAHGLDQRVQPERLEHKTQAPDVDIDRAFFDVHLGAPHLVQ